MSRLNCTLRVLCLTVMLVAGGSAAADTLFSYSFSAQSRSTAVDSSGKQLSGRVHGASPVESADGYALQFDGQDDSIELPDRSALNSQTFSFELWLNAEAGGPVLSKKFNETRSSYQLNIHHEGDKIHMSVLDPDGTTEHHVTTRQLELINRWTHVAFVCDGRWIRLFINGEMETFAPVGRLTQRQQRLIAYAKESVTIGASYYLGKWSYFEGQIAEVCGYDHALATADVLAHYQKGHPAAATPNQKPQTDTTARKIKPLPKIDRSGPSLQLVVEEQPMATIVIPSDAKYWTRTAAAWLQEYVEKATGAKLAVVTEDAAPAGTLISVGHTQMAANAQVTTDGLKWDGGRMVVKDDHLYLIGHDVNHNMQNEEGRVADGNCRAVTMFLEDVVGIRWFLPGPEGEQIPKSSDLSVPKKMSRSFVPAIAFASGRFPYGSKGFWLEDVTPAAIANNYRNGIAATSGGHTYYKMVPKKMFDEHPEYFALIDGKRTVEGHHLCSTNPEVKRLLVEGVRKELDRGLDVVTLGQEDGYYRCQCDPCEKLDSYRFSNWHKTQGGSWKHFQDKVLPNTPCERLFLLHKGVIDEVHKTHPDKTVLLMGYAPTAWPSQIIDDWGDHVWVELTNQTPEYITAWNGKTAGVTGYVYWFDIQLQMGMDIHATPREAAQHLRYLQESGFIGLYQFPETNFGFAGPVIYALGKLMGDPYLDHEALVDEYCRGVFGKAAGTMHKFYDLLYTNREQKFPLEMHGRKWPSWLTTSNLYLMLYPPPVLDELGALLDQAAREADTVRARGWISHVRDWYDFTKLLTEAIAAYRQYQEDETPANWNSTRVAVEAFNAYRLKILQYDEEHERRWFPGHRHFANWLTGDTQHESKVYYTWWKDRKAEVLKRGVQGVAIGYGGGLAGIASGYSFVREPLTLDFEKEPNR